MYSRRDTILKSSGFFENVFGSQCRPENETSLRNAFEAAEVVSL